MRICLLNPNSTGAMTEEMLAAARGAASPGTAVEGITASEAPATIEGYRDEALAAAAVAALVERASGFDAFVIACFGDPGLYAAREACDAPVVGIAEASFALALSLGYRFAILTNTAADIAEMSELVHRYGLDYRCAGIRAVDLGVADADADRDGAFDAYRAAGEAAIGDGAEVLCLGCGPMLGLRRRLEGSLGAPVLEPVPAGISIAEALLRLGHATSKLGAFGGGEGNS